MISDEELECMASTDAQNSSVAVVRTVAEMASELIAYRQHEKTPCRWEQDMDGNWETGCGNLFSFIEGGPKENDTNFCQYCGHKIEEHEYD